MKRLAALACTLLFASSASAQFFGGIPKYPTVKWKETATHQDYKIAVIHIGEDHQDSVSNDTQDPLYFSETLTVWSDATWTGGRPWHLLGTHLAPDWDGAGTVYEYGPEHFPLRLFFEEDFCPTGVNPPCSYMWPVISRGTRHAGYFLKGERVYFYGIEDPKRNTFRAFVSGRSTSRPRTLSQRVDQWNGAMRIKGKVVNAAGVASDGHWAVFRAKHLGALYVQHPTIGFHKLLPKADRSNDHKADRLYDDYQSADGRLRIVNFPKHDHIVGRYCAEGSYRCSHVIGRPRQPFER